MAAEPATSHTPTWSRFCRAVRSFAASDVRKKAIGLFIAILVLLGGINALNVLGSYVGRDFMSAIETRRMDRFTTLALYYVGVFGGSTLAAVLYRFCEERLALLWREWQTRQLLSFYLQRRIYYHLQESGDFPNPDQSISEDVKAFATTTLSFVLMALNATFTVIAFSGVLWSISPRLFLVAIGYATAGSLVTVLVGRALIRLNYRQLDCEANFRSELVHVKDNAEAIALLHREERVRGRLRRLLAELTANFRRIVGVNRNVGLFTTGYNYLIQIIPALIVAPLFIDGKIEFGVITQAAIAFTTLLGAFSLVVTQFQMISSYSAVVARLGTLVEAMERASAREARMVQVCEGCDEVAFRDLTLRSADDGRLLVEKLVATMPRGRRVLIAGPDEDAKVALFRAIAGIWENGDGSIVRPDLDRIFFVPERPFLLDGSLREALVRTKDDRRIDEAQLRRALGQLGLDNIPARAGGFDMPQRWGEVLSLPEQQLLVIARLLVSEPAFAVLDRIGTALMPEQLTMVLQRLRETRISYIVFSNNGHDEAGFDAVLHLSGDGRWTWRPMVETPAEASLVPPAMAAGGSGNHRG